jgi:hypothetical protein
MPSGMASLSPDRGWTIIMKEHWQRRNGGRIDGGGFNGMEGWRAVNIYYWGDF